MQLQERWQRLQPQKWRRLHQRAMWSCTALRSMAWHDRSQRGSAAAGAETQRHAPKKIMQITTRTPQRTSLACLFVRCRRQPQGCRKVLRSTRHVAVRSTMGKPAKNHAGQSIPCSDPKLGPLSDAKTRPTEVKVDSAPSLFEALFFASFLDPFVGSKIEHIPSKKTKRIHSHTQPSLEAITGSHLGQPSRAALSVSHPWRPSRAAILDSHLGQPSRTAISGNHLEQSSRGSHLGQQFRAAITGQAFAQLPRTAISDSHLGASHLGQASPGKRLGQPSRAALSDSHLGQPSRAAISRTNLGQASRAAS